MCASAPTHWFSIVRLAGGQCPPLRGFAVFSFDFANLIVPARGHGAPWPYSAIIDGVPTKKPVCGQIRRPVFDIHTARPVFTPHARYSYCTLGIHTAHSVFTPHARYSHCAPSIHTAHAIFTLHSCLLTEHPIFAPQVRAAPPHFTEYPSEFPRAFRPGFRDFSGASGSISEPSHSRSRPRCARRSSEQNRHNGA